MHGLIVSGIAAGVPAAVADRGAPTREDDTNCVADRWGDGPDTPRGSATAPPATRTPQAPNCWTAWMMTRSPWPSPKSPTCSAAGRTYRPAARSGCPGRQPASPPRPAPPANNTAGT
jgi:hypothetical protein